MSAILDSGRQAIVTDQQLDARQQSMVEVWEQHMAAEFTAKDIDAAMARSWSTASLIPSRCRGCCLASSQRASGPKSPLPRLLFDGEKIAGERIYWDQASVLAQLGLIDAAELPISDGAAARKASDPRAEPSNELIRRRGG